MNGRRLAATVALGLGLAGAADSAEVDAQLKRIFEEKAYAARTFGPARWLDDGRAYTTVEPSASGPGRDIVRYDTETGARAVLVSASSLVPEGAGAPLGIEDYAWSNDGKRLLLFTNTRKVWRRNTRGDYWVLDREIGALRQVGAHFPEATLMFAKLSPDGTRVAFVQERDLHVEDLEDGDLTRLTFDGSNTHVNGTSDWVYEEEFKLRDGFRWSPDGTSIAFWHFDSTGIGQFPLVNNTDTTYPVVTWIPYPKVGTTNSAVRIGVIAASGGDPVWVDLPGDPRKAYLPRMEWAGPGELMIQQIDRRQQRNDVWIAEAATGSARRLLRDEDAAWLDVVDTWRWLPGGRELLWISERDGWRHLWAAPRDGGPLRLITTGDFDVDEVAGFDQDGVYFIASPEDPLRRFLHRVPFEGGPPERITPSRLSGTHAYDVSPDGRYAFHTGSTIDTPPTVDLVRLPSHDVVRVLVDNEDLAARVAPLLDPPTEFFQLDIGEGVVLDGWMVKPPDLDESRRHPLLMFVYGEPANTTVDDAWPSRSGRLLFHRTLARAGYVVASVDNRGTPALKGREWRKVIYGSVGVLASEEQARAVRTLLAERPYLDPDRVASWGWSGGGSMTLNLMFRSPDLYRVGMSVAPVPDQTLYDTIYQERYMGLPKENPEGYRDGSPITFAEGLEGDLLIVHGSGDDNVHWQGTERLVNRLVELGKPFDYMVYPNRSHSINEGEGTSYHLHSLLARFLREHMPPGPR